MFFKVFFSRLNVHYKRFTSMLLYAEFNCEGHNGNFKLYKEKVLRLL
jgi:hypothetical protein